MSTGCWSTPGDKGWSESRWGPAKTILEQSKAEMGMVPNMYGHMASSPGLLQTYADGYKGFREESGFSPAE